MSNNAAFDASIPVLTEVFQDHPITEEVKEAPEAPVPVSDDTDAELEARAIGEWTGPEWDLLERRLSERILHQLQGRVDFVPWPPDRDAIDIGSYFGDSSKAKRPAADHRNDRRARRHAGTRAPANPQEIACPAAVPAR